mmetsp:Transcript_12308/g.18889  ORF Transcript_12308/g.18889 Transcript_12308/m.18889 type:complete len:291 (+) Transcript_12308:107-979(+)|eukprot:CAMPEP_0178926056 /NCGR_PEP_ID=MMETSP0786-20121207/18288_1 /TAXON_ID=186022 /ORGANISM="Thalassionema frauenfeldii, Strain CCMP 1798" /LENGTH=290 /DNA_ID=CAMNT_0020601071 /DNA_START=74 /DNA_END=946 /DNA_ORIENTATION=-
MVPEVNVIEVSDEETSGECQSAAMKRSKVYQDWIKKAQVARTGEWEMNVKFDVSKDTPTAPVFPQNVLFHDKVEDYAMSVTTTSSRNIQTAANVTVKEGMFAPCMVGSLESQFLKMFARTANAKTILDVGTFTGMSAISFAEGALKKSPDCKVYTLEGHKPTAEVAAKIFSQCEPEINNAIELCYGDAIEWMQKTANDPDGKSFDIIFIDADKDNYIEYFAYAMGDKGGRPLLAEDGVILVDNTLSALVFDQDDSRRTALHLFNQHVKNDKRVEQAVMTVREGISIISRV